MNPDINCKQCGKPMKNHVITNFGHPFMKEVTSCPTMCELKHDKYDPEDGYAVGLSESAKNGLKPSQFISRDEIDAAYDRLHKENVELSRRLAQTRQKMFEAFDANCHEYTRGYAQRYVDMQEAGLEEIMRKAEKWDKATIGEGEGYEEYVQRISEAGAFFVRAKIALNKIMAGLMVDEPKKHFYNEDMTECERTEPPATREATPEEVREFIEMSFQRARNQERIDQIGTFTLKSGRTMRLDFPYV